MTPSSLVSLVRPWLDALRVLRLHPVVAVSSSSASESSPCLWLQWALPTVVSPTPTTRCLEALELFVLLAWADSDAWKAIATELCAVGDSLATRNWTTLVLEPPSLMRVAGYEVVCTRPGETRAFCEVLSGQETNADRGSDYHYVRAMLDDVIKDAPECIPFRLRLKPRNPRQTYDDGTLSTIASLAAVQQELPVYSLIARLRCRLAEVHDDVCQATSVNEGLLREMTMIWSRGVRIANLPQLEFKVTSSNQGWFVRALQSLLGVGCEGSIRRVAINQPTHQTILPPLLSAVAQSSSIRDVIFSMTDRVSTQWMTYALVYPQSNVKKIALRCQRLEMDLVDSMQELFMATDPLEVLFPALRESIQAHRHLLVTTTQLVLDDPTIDDGQGNVEMNALVDTAGFKQMRVLNRTNGWWSVLLPGWGQAWINDEHAVVSHIPFTDTDRSIDSSLCAIDELELSNCEVENHEAVLALLRLIGNTVKVLRLVDTSGLMEAMSADVFSPCTQLEDLELREVFPEQLPLLANCFTDSHTISLKRVRIGVGLLPQSGLREVQHLLTLLADRNQPISKQLEVFEVDAFCMVDGNEAVDSSVLDTALQMLENNKYLTRLKLHLPLVASDKTVVQQLAAKFAKHHNVLLPVPLEPMGFREKAAFLSVVWYTTKDQSSAIKQFDRRVLTTVFEFVPDRRRRLIEITMPEELTQDN